MLGYLVSAIAQLSDPRLSGVVLKSMALTLLALALVLGGVWLAIDQIHFAEPWLQWTAGFLGVLAAAFLSAVLFSVVASIVVSFFLDEVADAVEARHYPEAGPARRQSWGELARVGLRFAGTSLLLNCLALPVYLFVPAINLFVFYGLNGYLMSRAYFELVAFRRLAPREARRMRLAHPAQMLLVGVLTAVALTVPVVNLVVPVLATALMVHVYHGIRDASRARGTS